MATYIEGIQTPVGQTNAIESHESYIPPRCVLIIPLREQVYKLLVRKKRFGNVSSNRWRFRSIRRTTDQHFSRPLLVKRPSPANQRHRIPPYCKVLCNKIPSRRLWIASSGKNRQPAEWTRKKTQTITRRNQRLCHECISIRRAAGWLHPAGS